MSELPDALPYVSPLHTHTPSSLAVTPISLPSTALLQGRSVVHIEHNGALYQLRNTRLGKLILTK